MHHRQRSPGGRSIESTRGARSNGLDDRAAHEADGCDRISAFSLKQRIPAFVTTSEYIASGSLISFGTNRPEVYRRAASYVKRILDGAKPADLPVEQPTRFERVVYLKSAKALGITIPQSVMVRADEVIR